MVWCGVGQIFRGLSAPVDGGSEHGADAARGPYAGRFEDDAADSFGAAVPIRPGVEGVARARGAEHREGIEDGVLLWVQREAHLSKIDLRLAFLIKIWLC